MQGEPFYSKDALSKDDLIERWRKVGNTGVGLSDDLVANVACEAMLRLSDPLLVLDRWREL